MFVPRAEYPGFAVTHFEPSTAPGRQVMDRKLQGDRRVAGEEDPPSPDPRACEHCGTLGSVLYSDLCDRHFDAPGRFALLECPDCRLVWLHPRPGSPQLASLYESYYTHERPDSSSRLRRTLQVDVPAVAFGYDTSGLSSGRRGMARLLSRLGPLRELAGHSVMWLPADLCGRLLDVGCGSGDFLADMKDLGWQVAGVEPDASAAALARERLGSEGIHPDVTSTGLRPNSLDAVTLSHVAEHLLDPGETLRACFALLKPGGRLVLTTPNAESLGRHHFGRWWLHWDPPRHIRVFNSSTLRQLIEDTGFEIRSVSTPSSSAHFVWQASSRLAARERLPGIVVDDASLWLKLSSVLFWGLEYLLTQTGRLCGEELLVIAEKPAIGLKRS